MELLCGYEIGECHFLQCEVIHSMVSCLYQHCHLQWEQAVSFLHPFLTASKSDTFKAMGWYQLALSTEVLVDAGWARLGLA